MRMMVQQLKNEIDIEKELLFLGLLDKATEIYSELGERAVVSYIRASYRLLSKVYHPDLNPKNRTKAEMIQQRLNRVGRLISQMKDDEVILIWKETETGMNRDYEPEDVPIDSLKLDLEEEIMDEITKIAWSEIENHTWH